MTNKLIGIAGGTGSGKTFLTNAIVTSLDKNEVTVVEQDSYYRDQSHLSLEERSKINYDHPDAIDFELLRRHLTEILEGKEIESPLYDFSTHTRRKKTEVIQARPAVILEGILILAVAEIRNLIDLKIYADANSDIRFIRRLKRDNEARGRSVPHIIQQYLASVRPMHEQFVEKTKNYADIIVHDGDDIQVTVELIKSRIRM
ncbi:MAG: uridine kinase [Candidatus Marinimicrobia bacterium]|nr:uridine kinase [Candidatus Neomarinimicrobiota bacterium]MDP6593453.1 uridine kinase [Candidatus Neomarinimicrobiota bacterium]MDP6836514.1 uridine kinase [Candidatus Neomarinimicrobiota bacterium]